MILSCHIYVIASALKTLLDSLLWDIYGEQRQHRRSEPQSKNLKDSHLHIMSASVKGIQRNSGALENLSIRKLIDVCAILKVEIRLMAFLLERVLISRDRNHRIQDVLCGFVDALIHVKYREYLFRYNSYSIILLENAVRIFLKCHAFYHVVKFN